MKENFMGYAFNLWATFELLIRPQINPDLDL